VHRRLVRFGTGLAMTMRDITQSKAHERELSREFIALAEETGLILKLGDLVLHLACAQIAHWRSLNLPLVPVSFDVSPREFNNGEIHQLFAVSLTRYQLKRVLLPLNVIAMRA
jgi:EAL domain-containing protein (putative c-di-GMP-specific phosphodiesterase class I)